MEWPLVIATFVLGIVLGYVGRTIVARNHESTSKGKALEQTRLELSQHKQEVTDHFEGHYKQLAELTEQLNKVNKQWNEAANTLAPKNKAKPLPTFSAAEPSDAPLSEADEQLDGDNVIIINQNN
ncbi:ZapG family protein [uncultured Shewanella sp.]|uniref:ZapG family protein n=1 Tax=Shewanella atlantica TaxID=271099 RepID=UPI0026346BAD|nr:DUF1043 family protein [uncultured Shewanella sp.]